MLPGAEAHSSHDSIQMIYELYLALAHACLLDAEHGLGGKLVYAGELADSGKGRNLVYAANIAGAASLAASANVDAQRQSMRDGVVDFLVTSLEEALRILKNEIRKRQPVSVAVGVDPATLVAQMLERGVLPDLLLQEDSHVLSQPFVAQGARRIAVLPDHDREFVIWTLASETARDFMQWLPRLDSCVAEILPTDDLLRRRWLRLAPRYLGRMAQRRRVIRLSEAELAQFREHARTLHNSELIAIEIGGEKR
jgi:hypothetical protein